MRPDTEGRYYNVTSSLIGWVHTQIDPELLPRTEVVSIPDKNIIAQELECLNVTIGVYLYLYRCAIWQAA